MKHPLLDTHDKIAWDLDETLINGMNSDFFLAYIRANPDKEHHIITFRTQGDWIETVDSDLLSWGYEVEMFTTIQGRPLDLYLRLSDPDPDIALAAQEENWHWKGKVAKQLGCTVLVDDMRHAVIKGCKAHGIEFVSSVYTDFPIPENQDRDEWMRGLAVHVLASIPEEAHNDILTYPLLEWYESGKTISEALDLIKKKTGY